MSDQAQQQVATLLHRQADLLNQAAANVRQLAVRAAAGDAGSVDEGHGYHYLVDQALRAVISVSANSAYGQAFQAAAEADRS